MPPRVSRGSLRKDEASEKIVEVLKDGFPRFPQAGDHSWPGRQVVPGSLSTSATGRACLDIGFSCSVSTATRSSLSRKTNHKGSEVFIGVLFSVPCRKKMIVMSVHSVT